MRAAAPDRLDFTDDGANGARPAANGSARTTPLSEADEASHAPLEEVDGFPGTVPSAGRWMPSSTRIPNATGPTSFTASLISRSESSLT